MWGPGGGREVERPHRAHRGGRPQAHGFQALTCLLDLLDAFIEEAEPKKRSQT